jgi:hypothetical protein
MKEEIDNILEGFHLNEYDLLEVRKKLLDLYSVSGCLPSDKEIINKAKGKYPHKKTKEGTYYEGKCKGFIEGANWMKWKHENINNR